MAIEAKIGQNHEVEIIVDDKITAESMGSGSLPVFATPFMVALMEKAAAELIQNYLDEGISSVGTMINVQHLSATPVGMKVKAIATLTAFDGRKASFDVEAYDEAGLIGKGTHERFSIKIDKFMEKTQQKLTK